MHGCCGDDDQFDWLTAELKRIPREIPIAILSHISILSVALVEFSEVFERAPRKRLGASHSDAQRIVRLFEKHPNVKLALSGHSHLIERIEYKGVTYLCGGAISGNWWRGDFHGTDEGYLIVDLFHDGGIHQEYVPYGWKVH